MSQDSVLAVQAENITRSLPIGSRELHILKGLTFEIAKGEWVALTGPSGSGKTTLLGLLAGIDTPTGGKLLLDGEDITAMDEGRLARIRNQKIGVVFQSFHLIPTLTAQENVEVPLYIGPLANRARRLSAMMLEVVGLGDRLDHRPHQLSGGEQQRVAIARALVTRPSLLLADEPTGNLDSVTGESVMKLFAHLRRELGLTMVMVTHDAAIARHADRELHLLDGRFVNPPVGDNHRRAEAVASGPREVSR